MNKSLITALVVSMSLSCAAEPPEGEPQSESSIDGSIEKFGVITDSQADLRRWSALWQMAQTGSIEFCVQEAQSTTERRAVEATCAPAVNGWLALLNQGPPDASFPAWTRRSVNVTFGCSAASYKIRLFAGRSNNNVWGKQINLDRNWNSRPNVLTHEFGHSLGLADTYSYSGGTLAGQPGSMMQNAVKFTNDDKAGVWAMWSYLTTGQVRCGPGYVESSATNAGFSDAMCRPSGTTNPTCDNRCSSRGYHEGECRDNWKCTGGCLERVSSCSVTPCTNSCRQYGYTEGQCRDNWKCTSGCLQRVTSCSVSTCTDKNANCSAWASQGECSANPGYMKTSCCASCSR